MYNLETRDEMGLLKKKVEAVTLVETLVALTIITIAVAIGSMIFLKVESGGNRELQYEALNALTLVRSETIRQKAYIDMELHEGKFTVLRKVYPSVYSKKLYVLELSATMNDGRIILRQKNLFYEK